MICEKCGANLLDGARFCDKCGANVNTQVDATPDQPVYQDSVRFDAQGQPVNNEAGYQQNATQLPPYQQPSTQLPPYQQQNTYQQPAYGSASQPGKGMAIASLICGIVSLICFAIITGSLGIIFGAIAKNKGCKSGMATAGIICGIIGVAFWLLYMIFFNSIMNDALSDLNYYADYYNTMSMIMM